jgi:predicted PurR-regulated permease PerM
VSDPGLLKHPALKLAIYVALVALLVVAVLSIDILRVPMIVAVLFSYSVAPIVNRIESRGVGRGVAVLSLYGIVGVFIAAAVWTLVPWIDAGYRSLSTGLPGAIQKSAAVIEDTIASYEQKYNIMRLGAMTHPGAGGAPDAMDADGAADATDADAASTNASAPVNADRAERGRPSASEPVNAPYESPAIASAPATRTHSTQPATAPARDDADRPQPTSRVSRELLAEITSWAQTRAISIVAAIPSIIPDIIATILLLPVLSFFLITDAGMIRHTLVKPIPNRYFEISLNIIHMVNQQVGAYIRGRMIQSFLVGGLVTLGLMLLGFDYAIFHGAFAGVLNLVPYVGPLIGAIPALIILLISPHGWLDITLVMGVFAFAQVIDNVLIQPGVVSRIINMHPIWLLVVTAAGGQIYGALGMIIAVPLVSVAKIAVTETIKGFSSLK